jgi:hypothetical protein
VQPSKPTPSATDAETLEVAPVSVWWYGAICFFGLLLALFVLVLFGIITGITPPNGSTVAGLPFSIHFANWRFIRKYRRVLNLEELKWFALSCGVAFYVFDEPFALVARILSDSEGTIEKVATIVGALLVDFSIVGAIVYGTVPWISKRIRSSSA